jgi:thymidine kinase
MCVYKKEMSGRVEIILGCMFSGKSTELMRRISSYNAVGIPTLIMNSMLDTRSNDNMMKTHSEQTHNAMKVERLMDITDDPNFFKLQVIGIDEAQFFPDLIEFVLFAEKYNKTVIIAGLDGDSNRKPFGQILECIPLCDSVVKLTAMDMVSKDATPAIFSRRIVDEVDQIHIGSKGEYVAVSRTNYLKERDQKKNNNKMDYY